MGYWPWDPSLNKMMMVVDQDKLLATLVALRQRLLEFRTPGGWWQGRLSSSALATATAVFALSKVDRLAYRKLIDNGLHWLATNQNGDGGWGDTVASTSNVSTTVLCWCALGLSRDHERRHRRVIEMAERWLTRCAGGVDPQRLSNAILQQYGDDHTFSVPILTMCALAGRLGDGQAAWRHVPTLPFELAALPNRWFKWLKIPVVSYALPALIAIGQVKYHHHPPRNPIRRLLRYLVRKRTLDALRRIQPVGGGFLEAAPLTAFVAMSLAVCGGGDPVVREAVRFLVRSVRDDGSWPIDTNLATWVTTLSINALAAGGRLNKILTHAQREALCKWLVSQQYRQEHSYTGAAPGGWGWTNLSGAVPDADDTAGALLALCNLTVVDTETRNAAEAGVNWLVGLQNGDGGVPTFCRGWGRFPFDRSSPDITAHAIRAVLSWTDELPSRLRTRAMKFIARAVQYLHVNQRDNGAWVPLWFGNQHAPDEINLTYGTSRVVIGLHELPVGGFPGVDEMIRMGLNWLLSAQNSDGGWGGASLVRSSIEETALAVEALARCGCIDSPVLRGVEWLVDHVCTDQTIAPSPIGLYFARLWYFEQLYPLIFAVSALERRIGI